MFERIKRIIALVRKEISVKIHDPRALVIIFAIPIMIIVVINLSGIQPKPPSGGSSGGQVRGGDDWAVIGVINMDVANVDNYTLEYIETLERVLEEKYGDAGEVWQYDPTNVEWLASIDDHSYAHPDAQEDLFNKQIVGYCVLPDGFSFNLSIHEPVTIIMIYDGSEFKTQDVFYNNMQNATFTFKTEQSLFMDEIIPSVEYRYFEEVEDISNEILTPALISILTIVTAIGLTEQSIVGDEPLRRLLLTPSSKLEVLCAKTFTYNVFSFIQIMILQSLSLLVFNGNTRLDFWALIMLLQLGANTGCLTGMLISAIAKNRLQADQISMISIFAIMIIVLLDISIGPPNVNDWVNFPQTLFYGYFAVVFKAWNFTLVFQGYYIRLILVGIVQFIMIWIILLRKKGDI
ncbi:hypothetical protein GF325_12285 [Candidatus Bathyarchaeota archaeon]|nr:hypothetical protein [Candidatus Bathyarchaeota archaeon]